ncbi:hypothetical protein MNBD_GAMMA12-3175 [hydrothermal vent metagenome]|uniref:HicA protein n=1 Tax=hydrothermal vent metagenome TaxID=652676 RepID=A0A3B0YL08_9ZZZZ
MDYDELVDLLGHAGNSTKCSELIAWLEAAGFTVKKGNSGNHYVFTHTGIRDSGFTTSSFACEHGRRPIVKRPYIKNKILNGVVKKYEAELRTFLE